MSSQFLPPGVEWSRKENVKDDTKRANFVLPPKDWLIANNKPQIAVKIMPGLVGTRTFGTAAAMSGDLLNPMIQGTANGERIGRRVNLKRLDVRTCITHVTAGGSANDVKAMIAVVYDRYPKGATFAYTDAFSDVFGAATQNPLTPLNPNNDARFLVLYRRNIQLPHFTASGTNATGQTYLDPVASSCHIEFSLDLQMLATVYNKGAGCTGIISEINTGALWFIRVADAGVYRTPFMGWQISYLDV